MPVTVKCSDIRLSECDWVQPSATPSAPKLFDHGPELSRLLNATGTRVILDVPGYVYCSPIAVPTASFTLEGSCAGTSGSTTGCTVLGKFDEAQASILTIGDTGSTSTGVRLENLFFRDNKKTGGDCLRIYSGNNITIDNVQVDAFENALAVIMAGRIGSLRIQTFATKPLGTGVLIDNPDGFESSCAGWTISGFSCIGGKIALHVKKLVPRTLTVFGGLAENQTVCGLYFGDGRATVIGWYGETAPQTKRAPAIAALHGAYVKCLGCSVTGAYEDAPSTIDLSCESNVNSRVDYGTATAPGSMSVLPVMTRDLPAGFPLG